MLQERENNTCSPVINVALLIPKLCRSFHREEWELVRPSLGAKEEEEGVHACAHWHCKKA